MQQRPIESPRKRQRLRPMVQQMLEALKSRSAAEAIPHRQVILVPISTQGGAQPRAPAAVTPRTYIPLPVSVCCALSHPPSLFGRLFL